MDSGSVVDRSKRHMASYFILKSTNFFLSIWILGPMNNIFPNCTPCIVGHIWSPLDRWSKLTWQQSWPIFLYVVSTYHRCTPADFCWCGNRPDVRGSLHNEHLTNNMDTASVGWTPAATHSTTARDTASVGGHLLPYTAQQLGTQHQWGGHLLPYTAQQLGT